MKKFFIILLVVVFVFCYYQYQVRRNNPNPFGEKPFLVEKGESVSQIAVALRENGFIGSELYFKMYIYFNDYKTKMAANRYLLRTDLDIRELVAAMLIQGRNYSEKSVSIIEGWTMQEVENELVTDNLIKSGELLKYSAAYNGAESFFAGRPKDAGLEGYLYPDTYRFYAETTVEAVVRKMLDNFDNKLTPELRTEIARQGKTIFEVLTLASIVEKEAFGLENRKNIADIFLKRLKIGMALQADSTLNYITKSGRASANADDLAIDSPYNTYQYKGLPPGPISNPSIEAIEAVLYPTANAYYYFLTTTDDGRVIYSKTFDEHVKNKYKYLR